MLGRAIAFALSLLLIPQPGLLAAPQTTAAPNPTAAKASRKRLLSFPAERRPPPRRLRRCPSTFSLTVLICGAKIPGPSPSSSLTL